MLKSLCGFAIAAAAMSHGAVAHAQLQSGSSGQGTRSPVGQTNATTNENRSSTRPVSGQVARSSVGQAGQRQTSLEADGIEPMARIENRVQNRIRLRINNRIDRDYDPIADASSRFAAAESQARKRSKPR